MIADDEFTKATQEFDKKEKRGPFYYMAVNLIDKGFEIEASLLLLATWNAGRFQFTGDKFDMCCKLKKAIKELRPHFGRIESEDLRTIDLEKHGEDIKKIYGTLSQIKGIDYTGASKVAHLKNREVFIMWDDYIRGRQNTAAKYYKELQIVKASSWRSDGYGNDPQSYFQFLEDMKSLFQNVDFRSSKKTFAKAIDEFNYMNITLPIQEIEREEREKKRIFLIGPMLAFPSSFVRSLDSSIGKNIELKRTSAAEIPSSIKKGNSAAIVLLEPEKRIVEDQYEPSQNTILELGSLMRVLSKKRVLLVCFGDIELPSNLTANLIDADRDHPENAISSIVGWISQIGLK